MKLPLKSEQHGSIVACCQNGGFTDPCLTLALLLPPMSLLLSLALVHGGIACGSCLPPVAVYQRINGQNGKSELNRAAAQERM